VEVCQPVICLVCELCVGVAACHKYGFCTVWRCVSLLFDWFVYCVLVWQHFAFMICVLYGSVAACHKYSVSTALWCGRMP